MRHTDLPATVIPVAVALGAVGLLVWWTLGSSVDLSLRSPMLDPNVKAGDADTEGGLSEDDLAQQAARLAAALAVDPVMASAGGASGAIGPVASGGTWAAIAPPPLVGVTTTFAHQAEDLPGVWASFRGDDFDGIRNEGPPLARRWPEDGPMVRWTEEMAVGYAGAAVRDGRVYVLDYNVEKQQDTLRCLSLADGNDLWQYAYPVAIGEYHGITRTTPATDGQYVVSLGPMCHVACVDAKTGQQKWLISLVKKYGAEVPPWYAGQCPLIVNGQAILGVGGPDALLVALDCETGRQIWRTPNPRHWKMTHSSILPMQYAGDSMYVYCGDRGVVGVSADDGRILWENLDWVVNTATVPSPCDVGGGKIFFCGSYGSGSLMMQLRQTSSGLVADTLFRLEPSVFGSEQHTPIFYQGYLYGIRKLDRQLVCLDTDGNEIWSSGRQHRFGMGPYLIADGLIYVLKDDGVLTLAEATPEGYRQLDQVELFEDGEEAWGPMAMAAGRLILRDLTRMKCIDVAAP